jgi:hypothetical protein
MMTMFNLIDDGAQFTAQSFMESYTKEFRDPVGSQSPKADLAAAFENLMDREVALEDEVAAVLYLPDGVKARQVDLIALGAGELRPQDQCPVVELLLNDLGTKPVGGSLQCRDIVDG